MSNLVVVPSPKPGNPHLYIATPAHTLCSNYLLGLVRTIPQLLERGIGVTYALLSGHCHVDDARNLLVADFLKSPCTDLVFIDADVGFNWSGLHRLSQYDVDIVGGAYPLKDGSGQFPVKLKDGAKQEANGLLEVIGLPTGFLRIRRSAIEQLWNVHGSLQMDGEDVRPLFERGVVIEDRPRRVGGDFNFCRKWRAMGGKLYLDPSILFTHQGTTDHVGCYANRLKQREAAE